MPTAQEAYTSDAPNTEDHTLAVDQRPRVQRFIDDGVMIAVIIVYPTIALFLSYRTFEINQA